MNKLEAKKEINKQIDAVYEAGYICAADTYNAARTEIMETIDDLSITVPAPVAMPRDVGEQLDKAKKGYHSFGAFALDVPDDPSFGPLYDFYSGGPNVLLILADAWRYGWVPEQEKRWYVKVPGDFGSLQPPFYYHNVMTISIGYDSRRGRDYEFTAAELKQYGLDGEGIERVEV